MFDPHVVNDVAKDWPDYGCSFFVAIVLIAALAWMFFA